MTSDALVTLLHSEYAKALNLTPIIKAHIQLMIIKKTLKSISLGYRSAEEEGGVMLDEVLKRLLATKECITV